MLLTSMLLLFVCVVTHPGFASPDFPDWQAVKKRRRKESGNSTSSSTASWMWKACQKKEWSLLSCLSRQVLLHSIDAVGCFIQYCDVIFCEY